MKFNIKVDIVPKYTDDEFKKHILNKTDPTWSKEETDYLWELCERFDLRFIVIDDQYLPKYNRTIEDLKQRYYQVAQVLLKQRGVENHPILNFTYNANYDRKRKHELEKFLLRPPEYNDNEKKILEKIKVID